MFSNLNDTTQRYYHGDGILNGIIFRVQGSVLYYLCQPPFTPPFLFLFNKRIRNPKNLQYTFKLGTNEGPRITVTPKHEYVSLIFLLFLNGVKKYVLTGNHRSQLTKVLRRTVMVVGAYKFKEYLLSHHKPILYTWRRVYKI